MLWRLRVAASELKKERMRMRSMMRMGCQSALVDPLWIERGSCAAGVR
jgi:hypothetical protein